MEPVMRYPGGDPENGPAYPQVQDAEGRWVCAEHRPRWEKEEAEGAEDDLMELLTCTRCGAVLNIRKA